MPSDQAFVRGEVAHTGEYIKTPSFFLMVPNFAMFRTSLTFLSTTNLSPIFDFRGTMGVVIADDK